MRERDNEWMKIEGEDESELGLGSYLLKFVYEIF